MMPTYDLPFAGSIADGRNRLLCAEIAGDVAQEIALRIARSASRLTEQTREEDHFGLRREAINAVATRRALPTDVVAVAYRQYEDSDRATGRAALYADARAAQGDRLALLLVWALNRLPEQHRIDATDLRVRAAVDQLVCKAVPCDMGDLSRQRRFGSRPASAKTALTVSIKLLQRIGPQVGDLHLSLTNEQHREVITPARLRAAISHLLELAKRLHAREMRQVENLERGSQKI